MAIGAVAASSASASQLVTPAVAIPDAVLAGATVARPRTASSAAFSNPAGLTLFHDKEASSSLAMPIMHSSVEATAPEGYENERFGAGFAPEFGIAFDGPGGWHFGVATYGSVGSSFKSEAEPAVGVTSDFYSELSVANIAVIVARDLTDKLSVGASVSALVGWTRLRYTTDIPYAYALAGPGVQAIVGARYQATEALAFGLGVRLPGKVWADGDMHLPDGTGEDVDLEIDMPAQIFVGTNVAVTKSVSIDLYGRWTDTSSFGDSWFRFDKTPQGDMPLVPHANDEFRIGAGVEYAMTRRVTVGFGIGYADSIIGDKGMSPLLFDSAELKAGVGFSYAFDRFTIDMMVGNDFKGERHVKPEDALVFPGRYDLSGHVVAIGLRTTL